MTRAVIERVIVGGPAGALEAVVEDPGAQPQDHSGDDRFGVAAGCYGVVCHPHPLFGGTMDNKVVTTVARALNETGMPTLRFNFRGVGASEGAFDAGRGETADAGAVASWGAARWPGRRLVIAGFSFGAYVALRLAQERPPARLFTVAPPVAPRFDFSTLKVPDCPWLVIQGDADDVVDPQAVVNWVGSLEPRPRLVLMPGVGHFFHGRLHELRDAIVDAIQVEAIRGG